MSDITPYNKEYMTYFHHFSTSECDYYVFPEAIPDYINVAVVGGNVKGHVSETRHQK